MECQCRSCRRILNLIPCRICARDTSLFGSLRPNSIVCPVKFRTVTACIYVRNTRFHPFVHFNGTVRIKSDLLSQCCICTHSRRYNDNFRRNHLTVRQADSRYMSVSFHCFHGNARTDLHTALFGEHPQNVRSVLVKLTSHKNRSSF